MDIIQQVTMIIVQAVLKNPGTNSGRGWNEDGEKLGGRFGRFTMKLRILETNRILYKNVNVGSVETRNTFVKLSKIFLI